MARLQINGQPEDIDVPDNMPLLWALRDELGMTGTKFGCGMAVCGACTVHMDGSPIRACVTPVSSVAGRDLDHFAGGLSYSVAVATCPSTIRRIFMKDSFWLTDAVLEPG